MAERGTNFYYPPDFDPKIHGSANGYQGVHHLRERARKIDQGIIIIRFEMPYNIWCEGCNNHIGMGVRYNAQKSKVGKYYSTIIYKFRMKCHLCDNYFEIQTDPKNLDYEILSGARRQEGRWNTKDNEQITPLDSDESMKKATNAMYRLEHEASDRRKLEEKLPTLERIQRINSRMKDDYDWNSRLRKSFRTEKKLIKEQEEKDNSLLRRSGLAIKLLPEREKDVKVASLMKLSQVTTESRDSVRKEIMSQSVFPSSSEESLTTKNAKEHLAKVAAIFQEKRAEELEKQSARQKALVSLPSFHSLCSQEDKSSTESSCKSNTSSSDKSCNALEAICVYGDDEEMEKIETKEVLDDEDDDC